LKGPRSLPAKGALQARRIWCQHAGLGRRCRFGRTFTSYADDECGFLHIVIIPRKSLTRHSALPLRASPTPLWLPQQLRQRRHVGRDPPRLGLLIQINVPLTVQAHRSMNMGRVPRYGAEGVFSDATHSHSRHSNPRHRVSCFCSAGTSVTFGGQSSKGIGLSLAGV
jgi:hypothetical protein